MAAGIQDDQESKVGLGQGKVEAQLLWASGRSSYNIAEVSIIWKFKILPWCVDAA